jgi:hypothetical protein
MTENCAGTSFSAAAALCEVPQASRKQVQMSQAKRELTKDREFGAILIMAARSDDVFVWQLTKQQFYHAGSQHNC